ncbi:prohibitin family protein [Uliginosibacterium gangwonense]|uniref:prohibitin family protein n=1 Tax=Uliginosibacterium gangwonense TaxID=392736 RepID=UPI0003777C9C|nr:prohibitin family protein [Uliginosibacterium gangwonense]
MKTLGVKIVFGLILLVVLLVLLRGTILSWTVINPGYTGIKINRLIDRGISRENVVTGFVFYNPIQSVIVVYPTFVQRVIWTHDMQEGSRTNEELTFNTKDSVPVTLDVAVSYLLDAAKVPEFYTKFRADHIESFTHGYLRDTARNVVVSVGSEYSFDDVNGAKKEEFLDRITRELNARVNPLGITIQQFGLVGALRPPQALLEAVNAKTKAIQDSIRTENEVRAAQAEAKKRVAIAEGEAAANRALASSLDDRLLAWERIKLQREAINKWNGQMPSVMSGGEGNGMLFNIPAPTSANK